MDASDPRADPTVVDLIELAGLWMAAGDWRAMGLSLERLDQQLTTRFADDDTFAQRFRELARLVSAGCSADEIRRAYRHAVVG